MKIPKTLFLIFLILTAGNLVSNAQNFSLSGEYRPRAEYHNVVTSPGFDPIFLFTQRTRLQLDYSDTSNRIISRLSIQDVRTWGSTEQLAINDENSLMPFEAWVQVYFTKKISMKPGRQVLAYDNQRILGRNDFQQQSRSHDIGLIRYDGRFKLDIGFAYNNDTHPLQLYKLPYTENNYKTMQFVHFNTKNEWLNTSLLAMNNGLEISPDTMIYNQTLGLNSKIKLTNSLKTQAIFYYQMGKDHQYRDLKAYNAHLSLKHTTIPKRLFITIGYDIYSGNKSTTAADKNHSFSFLYGSPVDNVGLMGLYFFASPNGTNSYNYGFSLTSLELLFQIKKLMLLNRFRYINSLNEVVGPAGTADSKYMGIENDLLVVYKLNDHVKFRFLALIFAPGSDFKKAPHPAFDFSTFKGTTQFISLSCVVTPEFFRK